MSQSSYCEVSRRQFLALSALGASASLVGCGAERMRAGSVPARRPNVLVILADDLGYADVGFQGCRDIPTPRLDRLAGESVRFTDGYVSCPVCSPTRAGLLTGRYQQRYGHEFNPGALASDNFGLPLSQITLPSLLSTQGYKTGIVGKWHLGSRPEYLPQRRGFDEFFGFLGAAHPYQNPTLGHLRAIFRGSEEVPEKEYLTDALTREALDYIKRHREHPFFLYLAYNAVHAPLQPPPRYADKFTDISDPKRRQHAGMLAAMDEGIGRVLDGLREAGLEENTLVFFLSDNGGPTQATGADNRPLRGVKATTWEGGIRVPYLVRWPSRVRGGQTFGQPVISLDILATAVAAAGGKLPSDRPMDGVDLMPWLLGPRKGSPHESLYWRFGAQHAIRHGDLKWTVARDGEGLFDLASDVAESRDLSSERKEELGRVRQAYEAWNAQLVAPLWGPVRQVPQPQGTTPAQPRRRRRQATSVG